MAAPAAPRITARRDREKDDGIWFPLIGQTKQQSRNGKNNGRNIRQISCLEKSHNAQEEPLCLEDRSRLDFDDEVGMRQPTHLNGCARGQANAEIVVPDMTCLKNSS